MSGKCKYLVGLLLCIIACMQLTSCKTEKYDLFTTLSGFVLDKATSEPLDGVTITLSPGGKNMVTGADGFFEFDNMDAQPYSLSAQKSGYASERKIVTGVPGETVRINITLSKL